MSSGPMLQIQSRTQTLRLIVRVNLTQGALNAYYSVVFHCYDLRLSDNNFRHFVKKIRRSTTTFDVSTTSQI
ncbi:hypothetical protein T05_11197 [Trichinella murrelli]|uniref:Uncharacterized protein n=1 Tax=Trichinella murrelli TaxID=144512 RepID=A0A0V0T6D9_9BILA|nr:hypothetical protein T05_11197 [Trichinella murrelli]